jgi:hypothetical protein
MVPNWIIFTGYLWYKNTGNALIYSPIIVDYIPEGLIGKTKFNVHNPDFDFMDPR